MNNFFGNILKKMIPKKENSEKKAKEEEDPVIDINLNFSIEMLPLDTLNKAVCNQRINGKIIEKYDIF